MPSSSKFSFPLPNYPIKKRKGEQLGNDNPLAVEVAKPLFDSHVFFLSLIERLDFSNRVPWKRPWHTFYLCIQGSLTIKSESFNCTLKPGDIGFLPADFDFQRYSLKNTPVQIIYIRLHDENIWKPLKDNGPYARAYDSADHLFLLLRRILDAHNSRTSHDISMALTYSATILELLKNEINLLSDEANTYIHQLKKLISEIIANPGKNWNPNQMAEKLNVSSRKLYRIFVKEYGRPPYEMLTKIRVAEAGTQLARTKDSIANIAANLGYQSSFSFSNLFKKHTGLRPKDYRKKFQTRSHGNA